MISVLILTKNEEKDIPACIASLAWCDDVHVFDSFSNDGTVSLALSLGANVASRPFDGYASQRNAALKSISFKYPWVFILDADERVPVSLVQEMIAWVGRVPDEVVAGRIRRRDYLFGTWLKHAQISPFYIRLVRPARVRYEREINEVLVPDGAVGDLIGHFDHYPFSKGISHWIEKHNQYSTMEAKRALEERSGIVSFSVSKALFSNDFNERRYHQKGLFFRFPMRPALKFVYMAVFRLAILDGRAGITYALLQSIYEFFIVIKEREIVLNSSVK